MRVRAVVGCKKMKTIVFAIGVLVVSGCIHHQQDLSQHDHFIPAKYPVPLEDALIMLNRISTNTVVRYSQRDIEGLKQEIDLEDVTVEEALSILLSHHGLTFTKTMGPTNVYTVTKPQK